MSESELVEKFNLLYGNALKNFKINENNHYLDVSEFTLHIPKEAKPFNRLPEMLLEKTNDLFHWRKITVKELKEYSVFGLRAFDVVAHMENCFINVEDRATWNDTLTFFDFLTLYTLEGENDGTAIVGVIADFWPNNFRKVCNYGKRFYSYWDEPKEMRVNFDYNKNKKLIK